jgi:hypothetical protein
MTIVKSVDEMQIAGGRNYRRIRQGAPSIALRRLQRMQPFPHV